MTSGYWDRAIKQRISRRRAIAAGGAGVLGAGLLAACGSSSGGGESITDRDKSGLLSDPTDTTKQAKRGGTWNTSRTDDAVTLDPTSNTSSLSWTDILHVYSHLTKVSLDSISPEDFKGDAAESWEFSGDGTQITFKLRKDLKFDPRPPTNGRPIDSGDVKLSFDKVEEASPYRGELFNALSEAAPIDSVSTPDDQTVVIKMAFPYGGIVEMVGYRNYFYLVPKEAATFDLRADMRGTGPFRLSKYTPSVGFEYERNDAWYEKDRPFLDGIKRAIIPDYSAGLAQFEAGQLDTFGVRQEDILRVKRDHPEMLMYQELRGAVGATNIRSTPYLALSKRDDSLFTDVRLRRAASMLIDRDLWITTFFNTDAFASQGLPVENLWHGHLPAGAPSWLDPRTNAIGEGQKYFQYNPAEAKKLIAAAGFENGVDMDYFYQNRGGDHARQNEVLTAMLQDGGLFKLNAQQLDYRTEWRERCQYSAGEDYLGFCFNNSGAFNEESYMVAKYTPEGKYAASYKPIPGITDEVLIARRETDAKKRSELIKDIEKKLAVEWYDIPLPGMTLDFSLRQGWLMNQGVFIGGTGALDFAYYWIDSEKKT